MDHGPIDRGTTLIIARSQEGNLSFRFFDDLLVDIRS